MSQEEKKTKKKPKFATNRLSKFLRVQRELQSNLVIITDNTLALLI